MPEESTIRDAIAAHVEGKIEKIIGKTARTLAANTEGISVNSSGKVSAKDFTALSALVEAYKKVLGPVAGTLAVQGAQEALEGFGKEELDKVRADLPVWAAPKTSGKLAGFFGNF